MRGVEQRAQRVELLGDVDGGTAKGLVGGGIDNGDESENWIAWISISRVDFNDGRISATEKAVEKPAEVHLDECLVSTAVDSGRKRRIDDKAIVAKLTASV